MENALEKKFKEIKDVCPLIRIVECASGNPFECTYRKLCDYQISSLDKKYCKKILRNAKSYEK